MRRLSEANGVDAEQSAAVAPVAKVASAFFPTEDVIQEIPVSCVSPVEKHPDLFQSRPKVADTASRESPANVTLVGGPSSKAEGERSSPFLLELFCGTAGVCVHSSKLEAAEFWALIIT